MNRYLALVSLCVVIGAAIPWFRRRQLCGHDLLDQILPGRFRCLETYLKDAEEAMPCEEFWALSRGLAGVMDRLRDMTLIVRLLQHQVRSGQVSTAEARYVWYKAGEQAWFSLMAIPEAFVCSFWRRLPHAYGLFALRCHYEFTLRAFTVCGTEGADLELVRLL